MANYNFRAPALPIPPIEYDQNQQNQFENALRLYFNRLDNYNIDASQNFRLNLNTLPTQASLAVLQPGDVYRDTTAGNTLKVKV